MPHAGGPGAFVTLSDGVTHHEDTGPDEPRVAVLVHGSSVPYYLWDSTTVALHGAGYRVIRYDLLGRGLSDRPDVAYGGTMNDRQLSELLAFLTTPLLGAWFWPVLVAPNAALGQPSDSLHPEGWPDWIACHEPQMRYRGFARSMRRSAIDTSRADYRAHYAAVGRSAFPVLLVWGKQDATVPIELSSVVRDGIPGAEYFAVDSAGHLALIESRRWCTPGCCPSWPRTPPEHCSRIQARKDRNWVMHEAGPAGVLQFFGRIAAPL